MMVMNDDDDDDDDDVNDDVNDDQVHRPGSEGGGEDYQAEERCQGELHRRK